ncbi:hypothetical protein FRACA_540027 [Frankia canadensis]|uniref:Uncharacterized protein n=1 Tax=Frankia canadensis TaxID=1836972 RepID=A0A2I2KYU9_9ACTN|nr:hypothetical protein [Frankia canadensis]SNQ50841.1 hypothetical protein FRACA_540027 [Frankia canadensis]SOU58131.1 hypothetical protein FRACA_540027 [Frankia canadensis]
MALTGARHRRGVYAREIPVTFYHTTIPRIHAITTVAAGAEDRVEDPGRDLFLLILSDAVLRRTRGTGFRVAAVYPWSFSITDRFPACKTEPM